MSIDRKTWDSHGKIKIPENPNEPQMTVSGRRYRVGEAGPEEFIPSRSGRIDLDGVSGGSADAKAPGPPPPPTTPDPTSC